MDKQQALPTDPMIAPVYYQPGPYPNTMANPQDDANKMYPPPPTNNVPTSYPGIIV